MYLDNSFYREFENYSIEAIEERISNLTEKDTLRALNKKGKRNLNDFLALISEHGSKYLEEMAVLSQKMTVERFGKTIGLFIPMYISNECTNICTYCGYSMNNDVQRITLNNEQILEEVKVIKKMGFEHVVILTGEAVRKINIDYFKQVLQSIRLSFSNISFEIQPLDIIDYEVLQKGGADGVYVYQETYNRDEYAKYHLKGKKSNFRYRLETPDRIGLSGIKKIGMGVLLGLTDPKIEYFFLAKHLEYLKKKYWKTHFSISFPRIKKADNVKNNLFFSVSDRDLVQYISAWRIYQPHIDISLSTRETSFFRDQLISLGINVMSACSKTSPGAYSNKNNDELEQFEISDQRSIEEIQTSIVSKGYEAVFKDWDRNI